MNLTQTRERIHNYNDLDSFIPSSELNSNTPDDQASKNYSLLNNVRDTSLSPNTISPQRSHRGKVSLVSRTSGSGGGRDTLRKEELTPEKSTSGKVG
jgi:hypothetical protein